MQYVKRSGTKLSPGQGVGWLHARTWNCAVGEVVRAVEALLAAGRDSSTGVMREPPAAAEAMNGTARRRPFSCRSAAASRPQLCRGPTARGRTIRTARGAAHLSGTAPRGCRRWRPGSALGRRLTHTRCTRRRPGLSTSCTCCCRRRMSVWPRRRTCLGGSRRSPLRRAASSVGCVGNGAWLPGPAAAGAAGRAVQRAEQILAEPALGSRNRGRPAGPAADRRSPHAWVSLRR